MKTIVGLFPSLSEAQEVKEALAKKGIRRDQIQIVNKESETQYLATEKKKTGFLDWLFKDLGASSADRTYYGEGIGKGGTLVMVHCEDAQIDLARSILELRGGEIQRGATTQVTAPKAGEKIVPVIEEKVSVGKQAAMTGGVRIFSRVTETPVEKSVQLREERVNVERRAVDRPATPTDKIFKDETIEVTETVEKPVVRKEARVVEEVIVGKDVTERTETVRDTVKRQDVQVEKIPAARITGYEAFEGDFRSHWQTNYAKSGLGYEQCAPAYRCGYELAGDPRFGSVDWATAEPEARKRFMASNPGSTWERFKDSVRYSWERAKSKLRAA